MTDLSFISDEILREIIARDISEMNACVNAKSYKSAMILAGSVIEAILVDYFIAFPPPNGKNPEQIVRAELKDLIDWAADKNVGLISETTKGVATVIREYRNLIHPGKEYRNKIGVDVHKATVAANLVNIVSDEIRLNYVEKLGYTAEQVNKKVQKDRSAAQSVFDHLIAKMSNVERVKLYKAIPKIDFQDTTYDTSGSNEWYLDDEKLRIFLVLHGELRQVISQNDRRAEVLRLYDLVNNSSKDDIIFNLRFLYVDIDLLEPDKQNVILDYVWGLLPTASEETLNELHSAGMFYLWGKYFDNEKGLKRLKDLMLSRLRRRSSTTVKEQNLFLASIEQILSGLSEKSSTEFIESLLKSEYRSLNEWGNRLKREDDLPF